MKKHCTLKRSILAMLITVFAPLSLLAQNISVSGTVMDGNGEPVPGAMVFVKGGTAATVTGSAGDYTIQSPSDAILTYQFIGFTSQDVAVNGRNRIDVTLEISASAIEDVVVVGYGTQRRGSITGAVATVRGSELIKTKNENTQNMLTGRLPGVRMWQRSAEPGTYSSNFDIRGYEGGSTLVVIDGIPRSMSDFQRMNPNDIQDISVLKDASAAIYGARSASGVLLVTTKKGQEGKTEVSYNGSFTFQTPSGMPKLANVFDGMEIWNESRRSMNNPTYDFFSDADFEAFRNGTRRPTDWNKLIFANWAPQTQHDLSVSGGNGKTNYYIGMGYSYQESFFASGDNNYNRFNVRSNISTEIMKGLTFDLNLSGMRDKRHTPWENADYIIRRYWASGPILAAYADPEETLLNYQNLNLNENAVAFMTSDVSGYRLRQKNKFMSSATLNYDFGTLTPTLQGLSLKGMFSFDYEMDNDTDYEKEYYLYARNEDNDTYNRIVFANSSPSNLERTFGDKNAMLGQVVLNYNRTFGKHAVGGLIGWEIQTDKADNFYASRDLEFSSPYLILGAVKGQEGGMGSDEGKFHEYAMEGLLGRLNYAYDDRYLVEAQFRYDGSSKLAPGHQWDFFPSVSVGWRLSEESFIKDSALGSVIDQFKLRASYGKLGNDNTEYAWLSAYTYPMGDPSNTGYYNAFAPGYIVNGVFINGVGVDALPNVAITWATSTTFDIGFDFEAWNGLLGVTFDYFDRRRQGIYQRAGAEMPTVIGATAPMLNANSDRQFGMELELSHRNRIGDFQYRVKAMGSITRRQFLTAIQNANYANSYDKWRNDGLNNRYQGVQFGYVGAGRFDNWDEIWNYQLDMGIDVIPGDYQYEDWNGDGQINNQDQHPYAFDQTPWLNYSLSFDSAWKNFDLSLLFQGSAMGSVQYLEPLRAIWGDNGGGVLEMYQDRWRPVDPEADPWNSSTQWISGYHAYMGGNREPDTASSFNRVSSAFFRLKSIELGYTLPKIKALGDLNLRVYANAYNVFTITGVKFIDPEHPDDRNSRMYPLNKTYTLGVSLSF